MSREGLLNSASDTLLPFTSSTQSNVLLTKKTKSRKKTKKVGKGVVNSVNTKKIVGKGKRKTSGKGKIKGRGVGKIKGKGGKTKSKQTGSGRNKNKEKNKKRKCIKLVCKKKKSIKSKINSKAL
jgi:hypothetical protein